MKKSEGRDKCFALGNWVLAKWDSALWRKFLSCYYKYPPFFTCDREGCVKTG